LRSEAKNGVVVHRAAVDALQGAAGKQASQSQKASDPLEDYLPLSINQRYPKYARRGPKPTLPMPENETLGNEIDGQGALSRAVP
jgi:hypothetical protein